MRTHPFCILCGDACRHILRSACWQCHHCLSFWRTNATGPPCNMHSVPVVDLAEAPFALLASECPISSHAKKERQIGMAGPRPKIASDRSLEKGPP